MYFGGQHSNKPILLTGGHRSGSTWVGKIIARSDSIGYIEEPFNLYHRPGICKAQFDYWFTYVCENNALRYRDALAATLEFNYQLSEELKMIKNPKDIARLLKDYFIFNRYRYFNKRPLMKDPIAVFSAEWLANEFNMDVIVLIRHPAAFAGSLKQGVGSWSYPFIHLLQQPLLIKHYFNEFEAQIKEFSHEDKDIIDQAILLWNIIHCTIAKYQEKYPNWIFIKHEELSSDPVSGFAKIFNSLNLPYTQKIKNTVIEYSLDSSGKSSSKGLRRDSRTNIKSWQYRLTLAEIERIKKGTEAVFNRFYDGSDWLTNIATEEKM